jgi:integrase
MSVFIQKRGKNYTASVRLNGYSVSQTFDLKDHAKSWSTLARREILSAFAEGREFNPETLKKKRRPKRKADRATAEQTQAEIDRDPSPRADWTLKRALQHYDNTVTDSLAGWRQARARIIAWQKSPLAMKTLTEITPEDIAVWVDSRRKTRKVRDGKGNIIRIEKALPAASTIRNDIFRISALFEHARGAPTKKTNGVPAWGLTGLANPVAAVTLPELPAGRQRRLDHGDGDHVSEEIRILTELAAGPDGQQMVAFATLAIETAMRRSEILDLRADEVRSTRGGRVIERATSKNGDARRVVLTHRATEVVDKLREGKKGRDKLFGLNADDAATRWDIARRKAGCPDLRMHDIRHEAMSRMADLGLSVGALAAQGGYKTMQTLLRYVNASERDIREKLARKL